MTNLTDALISAAVTLAALVAWIGVLYLYAPVEWPAWTETRAMEASAP